MASPPAFKINDYQLTDSSASYISRNNNTFKLGLLPTPDKFFLSVTNASVSLDSISGSYIPSVISARKAVQHFLHSSDLNPKTNPQLFKAGVFKNGAFKKIHLDDQNLLSSLPASDSFIFFRNLALSVAKNISNLLRPFKVLDHQIILYPSTALGRELHLDRHDGSRPNQNFRSLKCFFNLSDSYRIWGVGPSRIQLLKQLNDHAAMHNLPPVNESMFYDQYNSLPVWIDSYNNDKRLNHNISILNSALNNKYLSLADFSGRFDHVFFPPYSYILVDSKQVSHKPIYGEFGLSIDLIYNSPDNPLIN